MTIGAATSPVCDSRCARVADVLPDDAAYELAYSRLPTWRRRKCDAFRFMADRRRSVAAWLLLRQMLVVRGLDADSLSVTENAFGKPVFDLAPSVHFSVSPAGERVMAAVSDVEVGCDVERIVPIDDGMLKPSLADDELASLAELSGEARDRAFIRLWVRKESYAKAVGRGLGIDLSTFSALDMPPSFGWHWQDFDFGDGHLGCVCARKWVTQNVQVELRPGFHDGNRSLILVQGRGTRVVGRNREVSP